MRNKKKIMLGITGSIAAYKACDLIRRLKEKGYEVTCVLTPAGEKFITRLTLQTLTGSKVYLDMFEDDYSCEPGHVSLADGNDLIVVAPATADIIAKLASGAADCLLSSTVLASRGKILICPAMHTNMWLHPATAGNVEKLKKYGYHFVEPETGRLSTGKEGVGRLASIDKIVDKIAKLLP